MKLKEHTSQTVQQRDYYLGFTFIFDENNPAVIIPTTNGCSSPGLYFHWTSSIGGHGNSWRIHHKQTWPLLDKPFFYLLWIFNLKWNGSIDSINFSSIRTKMWTPILSLQDFYVGSWSTVHLEPWQKQLFPNGHLWAVKYSTMYVLLLSIHPFSKPV